MRVSIEDWVAFIKSFTLPNYARGEIWKVQTTPMIVVHLNFKSPDSKDEKKKKKATKKKEGEAEADDADDEPNKINYLPRLEKC